MKSAVDSAVCKHVIIDSKYHDDDELKRMRSILNDKRRQDVRIKLYIYDLIIIVMVTGK